MGERRRDSCGRPRGGGATRERLRAVGAPARANPERDDRRRDEERSVHGVMVARSSLTVCHTVTVPTSQPGSASRREAWHAFAHGFVQRSWEVLLVAAAVGALTGLGVAGFD